MLIVFCQTKKVVKYQKTFNVFGSGIHLSKTHFVYFISYQHHVSMQTMSTLARILESQMLTHRHSLQMYQV